MRKRPISDVTRGDSEGAIDSTAPTDVEHAAFAKATNAQIERSRVAPGARHLKRGGTQAGGAEADFETCADADASELVGQGGSGAVAQDTTNLVNSLK